MEIASFTTMIWQLQQWIVCVYQILNAKERCIIRILENHYIFMSYSLIELGV